MTEKHNILITGSSRGIGKAIALELAKEEHIIIINNNIRIDEAEKTLSMIKEFSPDSINVTADVSNTEQVNIMVKTIADTIGDVDILINNAGIISDKTLKNLEYADWAKVIDINLNGMFNSAKAVLPGMTKNQFGRIINMSSVIGFTGNIGQSNYAASKAGVVGLTRSLALEVAKHGITVNAIAPGFIETEMVKGLPEDVVNKIIDRVPLRRLGHPDEIAHVVKFLIDKKSDYITGHTIHINGGLYF